METDLTNEDDAVLDAALRIIAEQRRRTDAWIEAKAL